MAEAQGSDELRGQFRESFIAPRRAALGSLLTAARARDELAAHVDVELLLDFLFGALWYRLLVAHAPLDDALAKGVVDLVRRFEKDKA